MDKALQMMIDNMPEKTGKSFTILKEQTFSKHFEAVKFLKTEHKVTHGFANTIVSIWNHVHPPSSTIQYRRGKC